MVLDGRPVGDDGTVLVDLTWSLLEKGEVLDGAAGKTFDGWDGMFLS